MKEGGVGWFICSEVGRQAVLLILEYLATCSLVQDMFIYPLFSIGLLRCLIFFIFFCTYTFRGYGPFDTTLCCFS